MAVIVFLMMLLGSSACGETGGGTLSYAVFPYLPDTGYYQEMIEKRWSEIEPDIQLVRREWDCYTDGAPEGIDVIMFDAVMLDKVVSSEWVQPVDLGAIQDPGDIFPFALKGLTVEDRLYGIPVFLCGNFLIYDQESEALAAAEHITDLAGLSEILVVNSEEPHNRHQYIIETLADRRGEANPAVTGDEESAMLTIDRLAVNACKHDDDTQVTMAYDSGTGQGYIGFSESMRLLKKRAEKTWIRSISFSEQPDMLRMYVDAAAITAGVKGEQYEKCMEMINIMTGADMLTALSVHKGVPQYLLLARRAPYQFLSKLFPLYAQLEKMASDENNHTILTP